MNVLDLFTDLDINKIQVKKLSVNIDKKEVELLLKTADLKDIFVAHEILSKNAAPFILNSFSIKVGYEIEMPLTL